MPYPSVKTLQTLGIDRATAKRVRGVLDGSIDPLTIESAAKYRQACYHAPPDYLLKLYAIDALIGTFGVEHIAKGRTLRSPAFDYLNTGDTYAVTLIRLGSQRYRVCSWGDIVERGSYD